MCGSRMSPSCIHKAASPSLQEDKFSVLTKRSVAKSVVGIFRLFQILNYKSCQFRNFSSSRCNRVCASRCRLATFDRAVLISCDCFLMTFNMNSNILPMFLWPNFYFNRGKFITLFLWAIHAPLSTPSSSQSVCRKLNQSLIDSVGLEWK